MKNKKTKKSNVQLIISVLKTGETLKSKDISDTIVQETGKLIKVQDVASMLSRVSNPSKSDLGYFLNKIPDGNTFAYHLYKEACELSEEQIYGLTLKTGNSKYTIDQALKDFPELESYVKNPKPVPKKTDSKPESKKTKTKAKAKAKPVKKDVKKDDSRPAPPQPEPDKIVVNQEKIDTENNIFDELEKLTAKLKEMDGKDNMNIKDIDVNVSFRLSTSED
ncbi:Uncharacterized protein dnl_02870 [Desulfonema limicola]|uniref:Uncharacterized protein n=1 Tax=Desulfonema limicola TaxID=45656 RepID=A0A975B3F2_9BACT|nr:hypothetical protein [Desulfonema limicola]QTA78077.1 Uncharacterized protein dnl_02870 [Desulfonema limicola]